MYLPKRNKSLFILYRRDTIAKKLFFTILLTVFHIAHSHVPSGYPGCEKTYATITNNL